MPDGQDVIMIYRERRIQQEDATSPIAAEIPSCETIALV